MASDVDICNLSLSNLGEEANIQSIDPPDASVAAEKCAQFYPIARDVVLELGWSCNTRRENLASVTNPVDAWAFAYSLPTTCMKPLAVYPPGTTDDLQSEDFKVEAAADGSPILYTNTQNAVLVYLIHVTATGRFTPGMVVSISWLLSAYVAGPVIKGKAGVVAANGARQQYQLEVKQAQMSDANAGQLRDAIKNRLPDHIAARR